MNARNTIKKQSALLKLKKATFVLETVCQDLSIPIIEYLRAYKQASLIDLLVHTGVTQDVLERQLELLGAAGVVDARQELYENTFFLVNKRLAKIASFATQLNAYKAS